MHTTFEYAWTLGWQVSFIFGIWQGRSLVSCKERMCIELNLKTFVLIS